LMDLRQDKIILGITTFFQYVKELNTMDS
jgi:hypothetical protein